MDGSSLDLNQMLSRGLDFLWDRSQTIRLAGEPNNIQTRRIDFSYCERKDMQGLFACSPGKAVDHLGPLIAALAGELPAWFQSKQTLGASAPIP